MVHSATNPLLFNILNQQDAQRATGFQSKAA